MASAIDPAFVLRSMRGPAVTSSQEGKQRERALPSLLALPNDRQGCLGAASSRGFVFVVLDGFVSDPLENGWQHRALVKA